MFVQLSATPRFAGTELDWACRIEIAATVLFPTFFSRCTSSSFFPLLLLLPWPGLNYSLFPNSLSLLLFPALHGSVSTNRLNWPRLQKSFITTIHLPPSPSDSFPHPTASQITQLAFSNRIESNRLRDGRRQDLSSALLAFVCLVARGHDRRTGPVSDSEEEGWEKASICNARREEDEKQSCPGW